MSDHLCYQNALQLRAGYKSGAFTPLDVVDAYLNRIKRLDQKFHAYVEVFYDEARDAAKVSTEHLRNGSARPLEGLPIALKDLIEIEGRVTLAGSPTRRGVISKQTAVIARNLVDMGAIVLGKVHTAEYAFGGWGTNEHLGAPWNPWSADIHYAPGGSSSGSGVAVAARLAPWSIGTDTGGSVRVPSAFNGLVGLKTTTGRINTQGVVPLSQTLDTLGVLAHTVGDAAFLFEALLAAEGVAEPMSDMLDLGVKDIKIATISAVDRRAVRADAMAACDDAVSTLVRLGASIAEQPFPLSLIEYGNNAKVLHADSYMNHGTIAEDASNTMDDYVRQRILAGKNYIPAYTEAQNELKRESETFLAAMSGVDAIVAPTTLSPAIKLADVDPATAPSMITRFANMLGLCALAMPCGYSEDGLPLSIQIVCRPNQEALALRIGRAYEATTEASRRLPPAVAA